MTYTVDSHNRLCVVENIAKTTEIPNVVLGQQKLTEIGHHVLLHAAFSCCQESMQNLDLPS